MKKLFYLVGILLILSLSVLSVQAQEVNTLTFTWEQEPIPSDLAGFRIYKIEAGQSYVFGAGNEWVDIPYIAGQTEFLTSASINSTTDTQYYFVITAYDNEMPSLESGPSNEVGFYHNVEGPAGPTNFQIIVNIE